jgi:hypothetical protein
MFDFQSRRPIAPRLLLDPNTGEPVNAHLG